MPHKNLTVGPKLDQIFKFLKFSLWRLFYEVKGRYLQIFNNKIFVFKISVIFKILTLPRQILRFFGLNSKKYTMVQCHEIFNTFYQKTSSRPYMNKLNNFAKFFVFACVALSTTTLTRCQCSQRQRQQRLCGHCVSVVNDYVEIVLTH